jgi:hypothetical protein
MDLPVFVYQQAPTLEIIEGTVTIFEFGLSTTFQNIKTKMSSRIQSM